MLHVGRHIKKFDASFVEMMKKVEEKNMLHFVIEGNALKRKSKEKVKQLFIEEAGVRAPNQEEKVSVTKDLNTFTLQVFESVLVLLF